MLARTFSKHSKGLLLTAGILSLSLLKSAEAIEKETADTVSPTDIPQEIWQHHVAPYLVPADEFNLMKVSKYFSNKICSSYGGFDERLQKEWIKKINQLKLDDIKEGFISPYHHLNFIYSSGHEFALLPPEIMDKWSYDFFQCCLLPQASIARTQAIKLLTFYLLTPDENEELSAVKEERAEKKAFTWLFLEYLQHHGSEQVRNLLNNILDKKAIGFIDKSGGLSKKYKEYKSLLSITDISSLTSYKGFSVVSCFHPNEEIRKEALLQFNNMVLNNRISDWHERFTEELECRVSFLLHLWPATNNVDSLLYSLKSIEERPFQSYPHHLSTLFRIYTYGNHNIQQNLLPLFKRLILKHGELITREFTSIYLMGSEQSWIAINGLLQDLTQSGEVRIDNILSLYIIDSIDYLYGDQYIRFPIIRLLKKMSQSTDAGVRRNTVAAIQSLTYPHSDMTEGALQAMIFLLKDIGVSAMKKITDFDLDAAVMMKKGYEEVEIWYHTTSSLQNIYQSGDARMKEPAGSAMVSIYLEANAQIRQEMSRMYKSMEELLVSPSSSLAGGEDE